MPFYTALLAALGAFLFWYAFLRQAPGNGRRVPERRSGLGGPGRVPPQQPDSPVTFVNDPVTATATFLVALAAENRLDAEAEALIRREITEVMGVTKVDDLYAFARHAAEQVTDPSNLMIRFARLWVGLGTSERQDVYGMAARIAALGGGPTDMQTVCLKQLAARLGVSGS